MLLAKLFVLIIWISDTFQILTQKRANNVAKSNVIQRLCLDLFLFLEKETANCTTIEARSNRVFLYFTRLLGRCAPIFFMSIVKQKQTKSFAELKKICEFSKFSKIEFEWRQFFKKFYHP